MIDGAEYYRGLGGGGGVVAFPSRVIILFSVDCSQLSGKCVAHWLSLREQDTLTSLVVLASTVGK